MHDRRIIGIDPGISYVGWAVLDVKNSLVSGVASGTIKTKSDDCLQNRIKFIIDGIADIIKSYSPSDLALEEIFINKNPRNSINLVQVRGAIIYISAINNLLLREFSPKTIKKTVTGVGNSDKNQIDYMVRLLIKNSVAKTSHESDAYAIAYTASVIRNI